MVHNKFQYIHIYMSNRNRELPCSHSASSINYDVLQRDLNQATKNYEYNNYRVSWRLTNWLPCLLPPPSTATASLWLFAETLIRPKLHYANIWVDITKTFFEWEQVPFPHFSYFQKHAPGKLLLSATELRLPIILL